VHTLALEIAMASALRLSLVYIAIGALWIFLTDAVLAGLQIAPEIFTTIQTLKGLFFIAFTGLLVYAWRKRELQHLQRTETTFAKRSDANRALFLNNPRPMWMYDPQTLRITDINESAIQLYGYSRQEFLNKRITDMSPPEDLQRFMDSSPSGVSSLPQPSFWRHVRKNGEMFEVEINSRELVLDGQKVVLAAIHNISDFKRLEKELRESKAFIENAQEAAHIGTWSAGVMPEDPVVWSKKVFELFGVDETSFSHNGQAFVSLVHPDDLPTVLAARDVAFTSDKPYKVDYRIIRPDGSLRWMYQHAEVERDEKGNPVRLIGVVQDITERKQVEEELIQLAAIVHSSDDAVISRNNAGIITSWNAGAEKLYGYTAEEVIGNHISLLVPPERQVESQSLLEWVEQGQSVQHIETVRQRKDGTSVFVSLSITPIRDVRGNIIGAASIGRDISQHKKAEQSLAQYAAIIQSLDDAIISHTLDGMITSWNAGAQKMYGYTAAEIIGQNLDILADPERGVERLTTTQQTRRGERIAHYDTMHRRKDGSRLDVSLSTSLVRNPAREIVGAATIIRDITERKRLEAEVLENEKIRLALNKEVELRDLRGRFMSMVSHEFRNPLTSITMAADMIQRYQDRMSSEQKQHRLNQIQSQVKQLQELLDDMMALLKAENIGPDFKATRLELVAFSRRLADEIALTSPELHRIEFHTTVEPLFINADEKLIRRALGNLLSNAIKYSPHGGTIGFNITQEKQCVCVQVRDQGIGIPEADLQGLFEAFHRAANVGDIPGTGLGLTITRQSVELHNGTLDVSSKLGEGTTFTIRLPLESVVSN